MDAPSEITIKLLRRMTAALRGLGHEPALVGALAHQAWGCPCDVRIVQLLTPTGEPQRQAVLSAARGEGLQQLPDGPLRLRLNDAKLGASADVDLLEATTPFLKQVLTRAQPRHVFGVDLALASCEDLILLRAASADPAGRTDLVALLRANAGRIDAAYIKREAEAAGVFDAVKSAWQQARQQA